MASMKNIETTIRQHEPLPSCNITGPKGLEFVASYETFHVSHGAYGKRKEGY